MQRTNTKNINLESAMLQSISTVTPSAGTNINLLQYKEIFSPKINVKNLIPEDNGMHRGGIDSRSENQTRVIKGKFK